jgi:hypothetical protein
MTLVNWTVLAATGTWIVWAQRHHRWATFAKAMRGAYVIATVPKKMTGKGSKTVTPKLTQHKLLRTGARLK